MLNCCNQVYVVKLECKSIRR